MSKLKKPSSSATKRARADSLGKEKKTKNAKVEAPSASSSSDLAACFTSSTIVCKAALLVVGSYQGLMIGLVLKGGRFYMKFSTKHHVGPINAVALTERCIASSGMDERVFLFTNKLQGSAISPAMRQRMREAGESIGVSLADLGSVTPPSEVSCLTFANQSQLLFTGCTNGQLLVYRTRDWTVLSALQVHEKRVCGLAVHPTSRGSLVVTIGADRMVAVLDLLKETLITKWRYLTSGPSSESAVPLSKDAPTAHALRREEPVGVTFSESGRWLLVYSAHAFQLLDSTTMKTVLQFQVLQPQPSEEMHCMILMETVLDSKKGLVLLVGNESGELRYLYVDPVTFEGELQCLTEYSVLQLVSLHHPFAEGSEEAALLSKPLQADAESRRKTPVRHVARIKSLSREGRTLFSLDSRGIVMCWTLELSLLTGKKGERAEDCLVQLHMEASANCQGRTTSLQTLWL